MRPYNPMPCPPVEPSSTDPRAQRRAFYSQLASTLGPPDVEACVDFIGRTYGLDRDRR